MLNTLLKHKKRCQLGNFAVAILVLSMMLGLFIPANAEDECATDFFSQETCRSFDALDSDTGQNSGFQESVWGVALWNDYSAFSGSQIWYRDPSDGNWMSMVPHGWEALSNPAIHSFRCLTDLFGSVVCNRN